MACCPSWIRMGQVRPGGKTLVPVPGHLHLPATGFEKPFEFLLERESNTSILDTFELPVATLPAGEVASMRFRFHSESAATFIRDFALSRFPDAGTSLPTLPRPYGGMPL